MKLNLWDGQESKSIRRLALPLFLSTLSSIGYCILLIVCLSLDPTTWILSEQEFSDLVINQNSDHEWEWREPPPKSI